MKKLLLSVLLVCIFGTLTACGKDTSKEEKESVQSTSVAETAEDNTEGLETEEKDEKEIVESPQILSLSQAYSTRYEWQDAVWVLYSEYSNVTMWEGAEQYPEMDCLLSELEGMQKRAMEDEADNIVSFAQEMLDANSESFETQVSTLDIQVRRADSVVLSLLSDSYADYGFIEEFRGLWGSNYDVQTGEEVLLSDVILDMEAVPEIVLKELNNHIWAGDFYSETAVKEYFKNTPEDGISWTLDYNGVTFYFGDGDLSEPGNGRASATVSFAEYPELFCEKYMNVPEAYIVRLPLDQSFFTDLDGDGTLEELNCTGYFNKTDRFYTQFGIYTDLNGHYQYEELFAYDFQPYYVKTEDGNHYIYLFCEESEGGNRQMMLVVYNVNGGVLTRVGEKNVAPAYIPSDTFVLPLDPNHMLLDNYDSLAQDAEIYMVGSDGMPVKKNSEEEVAEYYDVEPEDAVDLDSLQLMSADDTDRELADTYYAYSMTNQQSGDTVYYPYFTLQLSEDGTGYCETENDYFEFIWYRETDGTVILESDIYHYLTPYIQQGDGYESVWFMMQMNENVVWIY